METKSKALPLPLVTAPKSEEFLDRFNQNLLSREIRLTFEAVEDFERALFIEDGQIFDLLQDLVGHEVCLVCLGTPAWTQLRCWLLVDDRLQTSETRGSFVSQPLQEEGL